MSETLLLETWGAAMKDTLCACECGVCSCEGIAPSLGGCECACQSGSWVVRQEVSQTLELR